MLRVALETTLLRERTLPLLGTLRAGAGAVLRLPVLDDGFAVVAGLLPPEDGLAGPVALGVPVGLAADGCAGAGFVAGAGYPPPLLDPLLAL